MGNLKDLEKYYEVDLDKVVGNIKEEKAKLVLLQFPDGLKQYATALVDYLREKTDAEFLIWFGACYGACDTPLGMENLGVDMLVHIGHNSLMPSYLK